MFQQSRSSVLIVSAVLLGGCLSPSQTRDTLISNVVKDLNKNRAQIISGGDGTLSDYKVYRDGDNDGIVLKFIYAEGISIDRSALTTQVIKDGVIPTFRKDEDLKNILERGIYMKYVYETASGEVVGEATISDKDL